MAYVRLIRVNTWNYPKIAGRLRATIKEVVRVHIYRIVRDIRASFKAPKTGRVYYYMGRRIRASAPGEPPAIRSGNLNKNVEPVFSAGGMQARIDPRAKGVFYAAWLEEGTSRMEPRPYITPAFRRRRAAFVTDIRTKLAKAFE